MRVFLPVAAAILVVIGGSATQEPAEPGPAQWLEYGPSPDKKSMRSMDAYYQRNVHPFGGFSRRYWKRSMMSMDRALQRNAQPYKRSMWSMDRALQRNAEPYKRSMMSMDRALQRNAQPYKRSMWSMDRALQRNTQPYKRSMWSMDRSLVRNVHPYKRDGTNPEDSNEALLDHLRELYGRLVDTGYGDEEFRNEFLEYINELEELKDQATPEDEVSEGNHKRAKRGEPFVPAMGAPSPPLSLFSNGVDKKRLVPDEVEDSKETL